MAVPNLLKLVLHWTGLGEEGAITFHYAGAAGGLTAAQLNAAAAAAVSAAQADATPSSMTKFQSLLSSGQSVDYVAIYEYASAPGPATSQGRKDLALAGSGGLVHPLQNALVVSLRTDTPGARHRGRQYYPGHCLTMSPATATVSSTSQTLVADTSIGLMEAFRNGIETALSDNSITAVVFSPTAGVITDITSMTTDNKMDTQRRREASLKSTATLTRSTGLP